MFQRISSPSLSYVKIALWANSCADLTWLGCAKVADELNHTRFSELQKVCVDIHVRKREEALAWVREELSCLDNRGILTVQI
jgi:hypothetical protein